jgi:hypothetical protein
VLADVLGLVGSSPTPGASDVGSKANNIYVKRKVIPEKKVFYKKEMILQDSQSPKVVVASDSKYVELERKIDSITNGLSRPDFNKILKELVKKNLENAIIICDYIITEQIEINIQNSTKESKIKVLAWLSITGHISSSFFHNSFKIFVRISYFTNNKLKMQ